MRESVIEKALIAEVKELGGSIKKVKWVSIRGAPDRLVLFPEHTGLVSFFVELKAPGMPLAVHQKRAQTELRECGFISVWWDSLLEVKQMRYTMTQLNWRRYV